MLAHLFHACNIWFILIFSSFAAMAYRTLDILHAVCYVGLFRPTHIPVAVLMYVI